MSEWKEYKLGEIGIIARGKSKHRPRDAAHLYGGKYPFIQTGDIKAANHKLFSFTQSYSEAGLLQSKLWPIGTVCITIAANIADTALLTFPACFPDSVIGFIPNKNICNADFIEYLLQFYRLQIKTHSIGSVQDNINLGTFEKIKFRIPSLPTQTAIAEILSSLDDKIELNNQINKDLEALAQALFKQWFIDFEFPNENGEPYRSTGGKMVDSELGEIPKGWKIISFKETVDKYIDNRGKTPPCVSVGIPLVEVRHMSDNSIYPAMITQKYVTDDVYSNYFRAYLQPDDILMSTVGTIGRLNITPNKIFAIAQNVLGIRFRKDILTQLFMFCLMRSKVFNDQINSRLVITVQASIKRSDIEKIPILIPNINLVKQFNNQIILNFDMISNLTDETSKLITLRDTLLPKLISGELEVSDIQ